MDGLSVLDKMRREAGPRTSRWSMANGEARCNAMGSTLPMAGGCICPTIPVESGQEMPGGLRRASHLAVASEGAPSQ